MSKLPIFVTGNQNKADYLTKILGIELECQKLALDEIQSTKLEDVVTHKVLHAYQQTHRPVLVDDTELRFNALSGLPGPFVKFFVEAPDGLEKLCRMLDSFDDRSAKGSGMFGYYDGKHLELFRGGLDGKIAASPRGKGGFGWDAIFEPIGYGGRTRSELSLEEDEESYAVIKPFAKLREFLLSLT